jgi:hypothetical protein
MNTIIEQNARARLNEALEMAKHSFLSSPIDVALADLKRAAKATVEADDSHVEELSNLVNRFEWLIEGYDEVERCFLKMFFAKG